MSTRMALNAIAFCGLAVYLCLAAVSFHTFVEPSLEGKNDWRMYADSNVYSEVGDDIRQQASTESLAGLLTLSRNVIVPALVWTGMKTNANVVIFNVVLFITALAILARACPQFKWYVFMPLILASPTTYQALLTLNKEIFAFFCAAAMVSWFKTRSTMLITAVIALSLLLRWEQGLVILCFLILLKLKVTLKWAAIVIIAGISITYPFAIAVADLPMDVLENSSSELYTKLNVLQNHGLFFALLLPKVAIALLSQVLRFWVPILDRDRLHDLSTGLFVVFDQLCMCIVAIAAWRKRLLVSTNPLIYFALVYGVIFLAAPENSPRYLYMLYVVMVALLSSPELQALRTGKQQSQERVKLLPLRAQDLGLDGTG